jgi:hypothetical protein
MRPIGAPFVVVPPSGARIRTRLRVDAADEQVLVRVGEHLGRLAGGDLAALCRSGRFPDQQEGQRTARKRALTTAASSRWAGAITRTSGDQWERGYANLLNARVGLRRAIQRLQSRLRVTVGQPQGRVSGYATQAERFGKQRRLQHLQARLAKVEKRIAAGQVSVCRGGRRLAKLRHRVGRDAGALTEVEWRAHGQAERWFLTADGRPTSGGGMKPSGCILTCDGWSCGCPPRWRTCPTCPAGRSPTGSGARSSSTIVGTSGRRRRPAGWKSFAKTTCWRWT